MKYLKLTGRYRDGGSTSYKDNDGKNYWKDGGFGHKQRGSLLYEGTINTYKTPALGEYELENPKGENIIYIKKELEKADKIFARYIISDVVIPKEDNLSDSDIDITNATLLGYEDEDGRECKEDGTYL